ncbi:lipoprotein [Alkalihalobacterium sp. APHAB7]|uniref:lipoprotein n=1 Tax=Alkalihalobacterium sp. APHAB7 TaxID=3402081 RepID=UPI003AAC0E1F
MKKLLLMLVFVFFLAGCNSNLTFSEIEIKNVKRGIITFFKSVEDENGIHLYMDGKEVIYVMLNGKNVMEGEQAIHFT